MDTLSIIISSVIVVIVIVIVIIVVVKILARAQHLVITKHRAVKRMKTRLLGLHF